MGMLGIAVVAVLMLLILLIAMGLAALHWHPTLSGWPHINTRTTASKSGIEVRFIGTSGAVISDGQDTFVIDGFVTRPPLRQILFSRVEADRDRVARVRAQTGVDKLTAILVTHSHYDHAMDAPEWVRQAGGEVWGTASTRNIALAEKVDAARTVSPLVPMRVGRFTVHAFEMDHAPREMMRGTIEADFTVPARARDYRTGGGLGFYFVHGQCRILVVPSAGKVHADLADYPADMLLLSIGQLAGQGREGIEKYWRDTVVASGAKLVIPIHWDDFTRPLDEPLRPMPYVADRFDVAMSELVRLAGSDVNVALPVLYAPLDLGASGSC